MKRGSINGSSVLTLGDFGPGMNVSLSLQGQGSMNPPGEFDQPSNAIILVALCSCSPCVFKQGWHIGATPSILWEIWSLLALCVCMCACARIVARRALKDGRKCRCCVLFMERRSALLIERSWCSVRFRFLFAGLNPPMCSEYYAGWYTYWGQPGGTNTSTKAAVRTFQEMMDQGMSVSIYMAHGGTNFGTWAGLV